MVSCKTTLSYLQPTQKFPFTDNSKRSTKAIQNSLATWGWYGRWQLKAEEKQIDGTVVRVYKEKSGEYTLVSFLLDNGENFIVSSEKVPLAIYLQPGDVVKLTYMDTGEQFLPGKEINIQGLK